jgi:N-acetylglucosamine kinase-like BadF-type ATPase
VARRIVDEAAAELAGHVRSLRARFPRSASVQVAAAGGLLQRNAVLRAALAAKLSALGGVTLVETDVDPAMGAVRLGLRLLGG